MQQPQNTNDYIPTRASYVNSVTARGIWLVSMVAFLTSNLPADYSFEDVNSVACCGCLFYLVAVVLGDLHPRVSSHLHLSQLYAHIVARIAWKLGVPESWSSTDMACYVCSHLCEAFWRMFFDENGISEDEYWLPCRWCVSPCCVTVEKQSANLGRRYCRKTWEGGCQCGSQPPCRHFSAEQKEIMKEQWELHKNYFRKTAFE